MHTSVHCSFVTEAFGKTTVCRCATTTHGFQNKTDWGPSAVVEICQNHRSSVFSMPVFDLEHASLADREDFDIVFGSVVHRGSSLQWASHALKNDSGIVIAAVQNDGMALRFVPQFQDDQSIVLAAISQNGRALQFASEVRNFLLIRPLNSFLLMIRDCSGPSR